MTTLLYSHPACLAHDPGPHHPESPARLRAVLKALEAPAFAALVRREAPLGTIEALARIHPRAHIDAILDAVPAQGFARIDGDTLMSPGSGEAALRAAGAMVAAVDAIMAGEADNAFCAVRPPGHHAEPDRSMGFCLFNSVAVGAAHALAVHGAERVAIVDFDVHHGNGSQAVAEREPRLFYASTHQWPLYPGTGRPGETGLGNNILNVPLRQGWGSGQFRHAFEQFILPALDRFAPDLLLISAGFDAHRDDPLAGLTLEDEDYAWVSQRLVAFARRACAGRLVSTLEGGYDLAALGRSAAAHVAALMAA